LTTDEPKPPEEMVEILLVEDSEPDIELTRQGLLAGHLANRLHVAYHRKEKRHEY
jgi:hypothetical protein